jgi:acyl-CoA thioesterase FadM
MVLLFRFLLVMFLARFRRRIGILDEARVRFTCLPSDCDLNLHLNAGRYLSFMDASRVELVARMRLFRTIIDRGWRPINAGSVIRFRRSVLPFQRFDVRSRVIGWDEKWLYFEHIVERKGELCAIANARGLFRGPQGNVTPRELLELAGKPDLESPPLSDFVQRWRDAEDHR